MKKNKEDGMTDLEIIKKNFNIITESEGYDYWYELEKEAIDAATRMAAEIERLKAELDKYNISAFLGAEYAMISKMSDADKIDLISRLLRVNNNLFLENMEFKKKEAALAEKPGIVRCGECKFKGTENYWLAEIDDTDDEYETFWEPQTEDYDFCSKGQRKEAKDESVAS